MTLREQQEREAGRLIAQEKAFNRNLRKLFKQVIKALPPGASPLEYVQILQSLHNDPEFIRQSERIARTMVTGVASGQHRTWREAALASTKAQHLYKLLRREVSDPKMSATIEQIVLENSKLIKTVPSKLAAEFSKDIEKWHEKGLRPDEIRIELIKRAPHLTSVEAQRIARTESAKAASALKRARCQKYNRRFYIWRTARDVRVRDSHSKMADVICAWDDPPNPEQLAGMPRKHGPYHPGEIYNCRCIALVIVALEDIQFPAKCYHNGKIHRIGSLKAFKKLYGIAA